ncbi:hypothetical protein JCM10207_005203 [Rhodosporidiobolus poonsookiae]
MDAYAIDPALADPAPAPSAAADLPVDPALTADALLAGIPDDVAVAEGDSPEARLAKLRTNYKAAAVSHWSTLFLHHAGEQFDVEAFEQDLISNEEDKFLPQFLGRVLNTLANDRNTNSTNWLSAMRRSYNRRVTDRRDNPFYTWVKVPGSVVEAERAAERERDQAEWEAKYGEAFPSDGAAGGGDGPRAIWDDEEKKLQEAEKLRSRGTGSRKGPPTSVKKESVNPHLDPSLVREAGAADVNMSGTSAEANVPVTEEALDDGFNAEMADVVAREAVKGETDALEGEEKDGDEEWYEEQRAVEWNDLSLETKLDAIYNVCEWHMVDPERQFRKYLQWDGESAWRLDPIGQDSDGNKYFHLADDRLWVQRPAPPPNPAQPAGAAVAPVRRPRTLLGLRAGPRDKSKKGTVTTTVRHKLKKDPETGEFVRDDEGEAKPETDAEGNEVKAEVEDDDDEDEPTAAEAAAQLRVLVEQDDSPMPDWEREYWEERARAENTPGFVEWEALCTTIDEWRAFPARFAASADPDEIQLRDKIEEVVIPQIIEDTARRAAEKEERLRELELKRSMRLATKESAADEETRRSSRHAARPSYVEGELGVGAALSGSPAPVPGESREDRLKKREEEKRKAEQEAAERAAKEQWEAEREQATEQNGGVVPVEYMTEDERNAWEKNQEKERKKREAEDKKRSREDQKKARARERRAELKAERDQAAREEAEFEAAAEEEAASRHAAAAATALPVPPVEYQQAAAAAADDPWWMDCEVCGLAGWNVDDGQELICCDECEEWQHLPCHVAADAQAGRAPQPFHDEAYQWLCGRCQGVLPRNPRPPLPNPPNAMLQIQSNVFGLKRKASGSKAPAAKKPKASKQQSNGVPQASIPYGHGGHPLYHPSAYEHPVARSGYTAASASPGAPAHTPVHDEPAPQQQQQQQAEAGGQAAMSYEDLKAMVIANPAVLEQLPPQYQEHFRQSLGL